MKPTWRSIVLAGVLSTTALLGAGTAQAQTCQPGLVAGFSLHPQTYTTLVNALVPQLGNLNARLLATVDQPTYALLLADSHTLASSIANGRVLIALPDGTVVVDTARPDDPGNM